MDTMVATKTNQNINTPQDVVIKVNKRSKRMRLSYDANVGAFTLSAPEYMSQNDIAYFLKRSHEWMDRQRQKPKLEHTYLTHGSCVHILGKPFTIEFHVDVKSNFCVNDDTIIVRGPKFRHNTILENSLKDLIQKILYQRCVVFAGRLKKTIQNVTVRDQKTRWGSCSSKGNLSFSWRLIFAPDQVINYLCIHEVCHLVEMNHSDAFWNLVETMDPDYKKSKSWLRQNGLYLMSIHAKKQSSNGGI